MEITIGTSKVRAAIQLQAAMVTATFEADTNHAFTPTYTAQWDGFAEVPLLDKLRGDFLCVPFGAAPASAEDLPKEWREGYTGPGQWAHGYSANGTWTVVSQSENEAVLALDYADSAVARVERRVTCVEGAVEFVDAIIMREDARLPLGLHPILRLPESTGGAQLRMPEVDSYHVLPVDSGTTKLEIGAQFSDLSAAPLSGGGTVDLTRLPLADDVDEIVLAANPKQGVVSLDNEDEGYRVAVEWEREYLSSVLLWFSNRGRKFEPWGGTNVCLGIEPVTSAFDFGVGVSASENPLSDAGVATAVDLKAGQRYEIKHRLVGSLL
ncbi:hypothetical protein [Schaalia vaccimaxillae]|uniref:hypothetical protein n=1 Tax=Schaalia vaccimaxillae TaxID=183916 RepID=UPI0003B748D0|nr:hypothetical protein [Schaalia vaccimaxillae]